MSKKKTVILALTVMFLWGSLYPSVKFSYKEFGVNGTFFPDLFLFAGLRFLISGSIISLFCKAKKTPINITTKREWAGVFLMGLVAISLHYACTYVGLSYTDSSKTALLKQLGVLFFICFSFLFIKSEKFSANKLVAALFGVGGIIALNVHSLQISLGIGEILIICASVFTVIANVICKKLCEKVNPLWTTGISQIAGGALLTSLGLVCGGKLRSISWLGGGIGIYILFATIVSYSIWYTVVQKNDLSYLFVLKLSEPLFSAIIGAALLQENVFTLQYAIAFACVVIAVLISNIRKNETSDSSKLLQQER